jgi:hypothetical protein
MDESSRLALALAESIGKALPPRFTLRAEGSLLCLYEDANFVGGSDMPGVLDDEHDGSTLAEKLERIGRSVLGSVQDWIADTSTVPWPVDADGRMAECGARSDSRRLFLWYGSSEGAAVITLDPIELDSLGGEPAQGPT